MDESRVSHASAASADPVTAEKTPSNGLISPIDLTSAAPPDEHDANPVGRTSRNFVLNLAGQGAPLVAAALSIPLLTRALGPDRFGLLMVAWTFVGYASLFDFGLSRALTHQVAETIGRGRSRDLPRVVRPALLLIFALGSLFGVALALVARLGTVEWLRIPASLSEEAVRSAWVMSVTIPIITLGAGVRGVLEGQHRFGMVNAVRVPLGFASFVLPVVALPFTRDVSVLVVMLAVCRLAATLVHLVATTRGIPRLWSRAEPRDDDGHSPNSDGGGVMRRFMRVGSWMAVSNLIAPILVSADRFLIGSRLSVAAVGYYAAPQELTSRLLVLPNSLVTAVFPAFTTLRLSDPEALQLLYRRSLKTILFLLFPLCVIIGAFAHEILTIWLGADFAREGAPVLQFLAYGLLMNGMAQVPFALVQAAGRADLTAKIHLFEAPLYLVVLLSLVTRYGVAGAAFAWSLRVTLDCALLMFFGERVLATGRKGASHHLLQAWLAATAGILVVMLPLPIAFRAVVASVLLTIFLFMVLRYWITGREWAELRATLRERRG